MAYDVPFAKRVLLAWINSSATPDRFRLPLLRLCGVTIGARSIVRSGAHIESPRLVIGDDVFINHDLFYDGNVEAVIGDRAAIGPQVRLITATHELGTSTERAGEAKSAPISIGEGSWLGAGVTVLPGVTIGAGCVIAAGAVVTRDCAPDGLYTGVPAHRARDLPVTGGDRVVQLNERGENSTGGVREVGRTDLQGLPVQQSPKQL